MSAPVRTAPIHALTGVLSRANATVNAAATIWSWTTYAPAFAATVATKHHDRRPRT